MSCHTKSHTPQAQRWKRTMQTGAIRPSATPHPAKTCDSCTAPTTCLLVFSMFFTRKLELFSAFNRTVCTWIKAATKHHKTQQPTPIVWTVSVHKAGNPITFIQPCRKPVMEVMAVSIPLSKPYTSAAHPHEGNAKYSRLLKCLGKHQDSDQMSDLLD